MLGWMRNNAGSWIIKFIFGIIIIVFCFWGVGSYRDQKINRVAVVNGEAITIDSYNSAYNSMLRELRQRYGNKLNDQTLKMFNLKKRAVDQIINNSLLLYESKRLGFQVTDKELSDSIRNISAFQVDSVFNMRTYNAVLNANRLTPETFEASHKQSLLIEKLTSFVTSSVKVSEPELKQFINWANASVKVDYVLFNPEKYKDIKPTNKQIKTYFNENKDDYKTDPLLKVRYIRFNPASYKLELTEQEILDYYDSNMQEFETEKTVEARHILIKLKSDAGEEAVNKAKINILEILEKAKNGDDFATLAKKYSECPSKDRGGHLGTFTRTSMVKPFADEAFSMEQGQISDPVRTDFGWHIIKVENVNPASTRSFEQAKTDIRKKLTERKTKNAAYDQAEAVYEDAYQYQNLEQVAKDRELKIETTQYFTKKGPEKGILRPGKFASLAFKLPVSEISEIEFLDDGYYILQPIEKIPPKIPEIASVKQKVRADLIKNMQDKKAEEQANAFLTFIKKTAEKDKHLKTIKRKISTTDFFKRYESIPDIGFEQEIIQTAFELSPGGRFPETVLRGKKGYYVIWFNQRKEPDPEEIKDLEDQTRKRLIQEKQNKIISALLKEVRNNSEVVIEDRFSNIQ
jgi:peptidyl-prolyl cis-trans isomerase D